MNELSFLKSALQPTSELTREQIDFRLKSAEIIMQALHEACVAFNRVSVEQRDKFMFGDKIVEGTCKVVHPGQLE